ncbi:MAG: amidophosphoribosyltransferase [Myxococcales bacterium]|nr:amidophosphoribosyltransferase [Myxococcales bacterium]
MDKSLKHECGVFGVFGHKEASNLTYLGLHALQHRGQESAGIAVVDERTMRVHRQMGYVADIFDATILDALVGSSAIGHVRYSTAGGSVLKNAQPFTVETRRGNLAVAHNGNLVNAERLRQDLEDKGDLFYTNADTEVIAHVLARHKKGSLEERVGRVMRRIKGAYSFVMLAGEKLIAARDPQGYRPLVLGRLGDAYIISSETCALSLIGAKFEREIEPGEVVCISDEGVTSSFPLGKTKKEKVQQCIFELIYFARPDSHIFDRSVYAIRKQFGVRLAQESNVPDADCVIPVPDSGVVAAMGFAETAQIPYEMGLIRNHYVGRTFIEPTQQIRHFGVRLKLNPVEELISGRSIIVVDDSIVRATTSRKIVSMLRAAGAKEVHMRISAPPILWPCYYGIDTPERSQLIASSHSVQEICEYIEADSLAFLSQEGMMETAQGTTGGFCDACFTGNYFIPPDEITAPAEVSLYEN